MFYADTGSIQRPLKRPRTAVDTAMLVGWKLQGASRDVNVDSMDPGQGNAGILQTKAAMPLDEDRPMTCLTP